MEISDRVRAGDVRAMARLISLIENGFPEATSALKGLYPFTGQAFIVGITGPPGSGKSTLTDQLTQEFRRHGRTIGIVAVDPTSPFTGGAILADRIRMQRHSLDGGVFIRSMATRGHLGGLAKATNDVVNVLDAAGKEVIFIETVGVGQDEVEVVKTAHTSIVVTVPGLGDDIQAIKAGILEIADIFVVNKADREGADKTVAELKAMMALGPGRSDWSPPIFKTVAIEEEGIVELAQGILAHQAHLDQAGVRQERQRERSHALFLELLQERVTRRLLERAAANGILEQTIERIAHRDLDPYSAVDEFLEKAGF
ncbi:MAG: methylmalonyl Co-A mutase-associated GTPase MeaB [candidate division NC10 bacterium]|nr:methylmalonyl Co-A mutase-associated GTPase MeaB [candidate division NC10 bacterium]